MSQRPMTGMRVGSSYGRKRTALRTGRTGTGFKTGRMGTARQDLGTGSLNSKVNVGERVMLDHGLGGSRPKTQGPGRQVMDDSFFLGALRSKSSELTKEIERLQKEFTKLERDHATYSTYEKKAEGLATDLQALNGELSDWNMLVGNFNENIDISEVQADYEEMKARNDREANEVDNIFSSRNKVEGHIKEVEADIEEEKRAKENIVDEMNDEEHALYEQMSAESAQLQQQIEEQQSLVDKLAADAAALQKELDNSPIKKEAAALLDQIAAMKVKRDKLVEEMQKEAMLSPEMLKENLIQQVKDDNIEINAMERKYVEVQSRINELSSDIADIDTDVEEVDEEKRQKYLQLLKHEQEMDAFLLSYDADMDEERRKHAELEETIENLLQSITTSMQNQHLLPSQEDATTLKHDLDFKTDELQKSEKTAKSLEQQRQTLMSDLERVEHLEEKIEEETQQLQDDMQRMKDELVKYSDIEGLIQQTEDEKNRLTAEKKRLTVRKAAMKKVVTDLASRHEKVVSKLNAHETHTQISNLEKKWQHYEKNNFNVKDFVLAKEKEADYSSVRTNVNGMVEAHNDYLKDSCKKS
eukprot:m.199004 g.199004  ORF g.199004 m.199004 type:complete len:585 (-) comp13692_c3_seq1:662-2416(-)